MKLCELCSHKKYGYSDGVNEVWVCYKCGSFNGVTTNHDEFAQVVSKNPLILLELISTKTLEPISSNE
tara:strand:+ start:18123 stop:18326 length:204 start_codon:yes stop_codon:yes gene_type:complete